MSIVINLDKAKEIKKNMVRVERAPLLADLDIQFMRAVEMGDIKSQAEISTRKQALRDATQSHSILEATTVEALKDADPVKEAVSK